MRILLIEDDRQIRRQVSEALASRGYVTDQTGDPDDAQHLGETEPYDAVILDLGLPGRDGIDILRHWRQAGSKVPVLILTARDGWTEKVKGLRTGADDYLAKPFVMEELLARIEALIRRAHGAASPMLRIGAVALDVTAGRVPLSGNPVELTALEHRLLAYLMHRPGAIVSKTELTEHIYDQSFDRDSNVIEVMVNRLRRKLGAEFIRTRRGMGYLVEDGPQA